MKILITNRLYHPVVGGTVILTDSIASVLVKQGYDVRITTKTREEGNEISPFSVVRTSSLLDLFRQIMWSDGIIMIEPSVFYAGSAWLFKKPRMGLLQTWFLVKPTDLNPKRRLQRLLSHFFSQYSAPSQIVADEWGAGYQIIPNGYDSEYFYNRKLAREYDFVFLGRFHSEKGPDLYVKALAELHLKEIDFRALMIGDGDMMDLCKEIVLSIEGLSDKIIFTGEIRDRSKLASLMNQSKVIVIPNRWDEPFGMVALEGLACGCRPVITKSGALEEVCGGYATVVEKNNLKALEEALLLEMGLPPYGSKGLLEHLGRFHWEGLVKRYLAMMRINA